MRRLLLLLAVFLELRPAAGEGVRTGAFAPLEYGARAAALAGANVADPWGGEAVSWNPAALARFRQHHLDSSYGDLYGLDLIHHLHVGLTVPAVERGASGLELRYNGISGFDPEGETISAPSYSELSMAFAHARTFGALAWGGTLRLEFARGSLQEEDDVSGTGAALDLGLLYRQTPDLRLGLLLRNLGSLAVWQLGTNETTDRRPLAVVIGMAWRGLLPGLRLCADAESGEERSQGLGGIARRVALGVEWNGFAERLALRGGGALRGHGEGTRVQLATGFGVRLNELALNYAASLDEEGLGTTHRFGLSVAW